MSVQSRERSAKRLEPFGGDSPRIHEGAKAGILIREHIGHVAQAVGRTMRNGGRGRPRAPGRQPVGERRPRPDGHVPGCYDSAMADLAGWRFGVEEAPDDEDPAGRQRVSGWIARAVGRRKESIERHGNVLCKNELVTLQALITPS